MADADSSTWAVEQRALTVTRVEQPTEALPMTFSDLPFEIRRLIWEEVVPHSTSKYPSKTNNILEFAAVVNSSSRTLQSL